MNYMTAVEDLGFSHPNALEKTREQRREEIQRAEDALLSMPQPDLRSSSYFAEGLYAKDLLIPAGVAVTGKIHLKEHLVIIAYGDVTVTDDSGSRRLTGYQTIVGTPGSKRAVLAHADTMWIAIHASDAKTAEEAENTLVTNNYGDLRLEAS